MKNILFLKFDCSTVELQLPKNGNFSNSLCFFECVFHELLRKLEEYNRRNDEIEDLAYKTLEGTVYQSRLAEKVGRSRGDGLVMLEQNFSGTEIAKLQITEIVDDLVENGEVFKGDLSRYSDEVVAKLKILEEVGKGFQDSIKCTEFK